jgi:hypothetical protein
MAVVLEVLERALKAVQIVGAVVARDLGGRAVLDVVVRGGEDARVVQEAAFRAANFA